MPFSTAPTHHHFTCMDELDSFLLERRSKTRTRKLYAHAELIQVLCARGFGARDIAAFLLEKHGTSVSRQAIEKHLSRRGLSCNGKSAPAEKLRPSTARSTPPSPQPPSSTLVTNEAGGTTARLKDAPDDRFFESKAASPAPYHAEQDVTQAGHNSASQPVGGRPDTIVLSHFDPTSPEHVARKQRLIEQVHPLRQSRAPHQRTNDN
jgi:hypothetical protein